MITYILNHTHEDGFNTFGISAFAAKAYKIRVGNQRKLS